MENKLTNNPSRSELITDFVKTNPNYYIKEFQKKERHTIKEYGFLMTK